MISAGDSGEFSDRDAGSFSDADEPDEEEVLEYARAIGISPENEADLLWVARAGISAPLPSEWRPIEADDGELYFYNFKTGESIWEHPSDEKYRKMVIEERKKAQLHHQRLDSAKPKALDRTAAPVALVPPPRGRLAPLTAGTSPVGASGRPKTSHGPAQSAPPTSQLLDKASASQKPVPTAAVDADKVDVLEKFNVHLDMDVLSLSPSPESQKPIIAAVASKPEQKPASHTPTKEPVVPASDKRKMFGNSTTKSSSTSESSSAKNSNSNSSPNAKIIPHISKGTPISEKPADNDSREKSVQQSLENSQKPIVADLAKLLAEEKQKLESEWRERLDSLKRENEDKLKALEVSLNEGHTAKLTSALAQTEQEFEQKLKDQLQAERDNCERRLNDQRADHELHLAKSRREWREAETEKAPAVAAESADASTDTADLLRRLHKATATETTARRHCHSQTVTTRAVTATQTEELPPSSTLNDSRLDQLSNAVAELKQFMTNEIKAGPGEKKITPNLNSTSTQTTAPARSQMNDRATSNPTIPSEVVEQAKEFIRKQEAAALAERLEIVTSAQSEFGQPDDVFPAFYTPPPNFHATKSDLECLGGQFRRRTTDRKRFDAEKYLNDRWLEYNNNSSQTVLSPSSILKPSYTRVRNLDKNVDFDSRLRSLKTWVDDFSKNLQRN